MTAADERSKPSPLIGKYLGALAMVFLGAAQVLALASEDGDRWNVVLLVAAVMLLGAAIIGIVVEQSKR